MPNSSNVFDNSEASTIEDTDNILSEEERHVRVFATQMLKGRIFLGQFQERRRVDLLQAYRDVIVVSQTEVELIKDIDIVKQRLRTYYGETYWIGMTNPNSIGCPRGHCIWIESENNTLGYYWYKIRGIRFRENEIILRLKVVRAMSDGDNIENLSRQTNFAQQLGSDISMNNIFDNFSLNAALENIKNTLVEYAIWFFTTVLTINNLREAATFLSILLATGVTLSIKGFGCFMDFILRFMRETSYFVQSSTPVMIAVVNLIGKVIGGFYLLIAMIWRDRGVPVQVQRQYVRPIAHKPIQMRYNNRPSLTITEVD